MSFEIEPVVSTERKHRGTAEERKRERNRDSEGRGTIAGIQNWPGSNVQLNLIVSLL